MNRKSKAMAWAVPALVIAALAVAAVAFNEQIVSWFQPGSDTAEVSTMGGMTMGGASESAEPDSQPASQPSSQPAGDQGHAGHPHPVAEGEAAYYTCSMHPSVRSDDPEATCPICAMDLVPVTHEEIETGMVMVDDLRRQRFGVKVEPVRRMELEKNIRAVGRLMLDERRIADVTTRFGGYIGEVFAEAEGNPVEAGAPLFTIYSPEVLSAQEELLETVKRQGAGGSLAESAARRLRLWGLGEGFAAELRQNGEAVEYVPIAAPLSGVVIEKNVYPGTAVQAGQTLYRLADLSTLWLEAEVFESEVGLIEEGQQVLVTTPHLPGRRFEATVEYVYPRLDPQTRTARLRIAVPNEDGELMPEMYVNAGLSAPLGNQLVVPETAVLYAGEKRIVFIDEGDGRLEPREVEVGPRTDDFVAILSGLDESDRVVTSGNFLIAAESKMKSAVQKW